MTRKRLGELLVEAGLLGVAQLESALAHQRQWGGRLGRIVVQMGFTPEPRMLRILAGHLGVPLADPPADDLNPRIIDQIPADLATRWMVFPLAMRRDVAGEALVVAMSDPTSGEAVDAIRQHTGRIVYVALAGDTQIEAWIRRHYFGEGRRPPSDTAIPLVTGALATPAPQPSPVVTPAANPFASAVVQPLTVDDPFAVLDLKPVEVPGSRTSAGMVGLAELQPISANSDVVDLEPIPDNGWSPPPPPAPVFDTSGGFLSRDDDDPGALPPPNPFAASSFEAPSFAAPPVAPPVIGPPPPSFAAPSFAGPLPAPPAPPSRGPARSEDPFGAFPSTIALVEMPAPTTPPPPAAAPSSALAASWADALVTAPPTPAPERPPPTAPPTAAASTCPRCTSPRVEGARFCPFCGLSFVASTVPTASPTPPTPPAPAAPLPALATHGSDIPVSAEAMPTPIATGVLILDDGVVEAAMARRGTPMPMPSLAVIHALDAIAIEGPPPPSPFDALAAPAPGDARTDAVAVALPDTAPLGEPVLDAAGDAVVEPASAIDPPTDDLPLEPVPTANKVEVADDSAARDGAVEGDVDVDLDVDVADEPPRPDTAAATAIDPTLQTLELSILEELPAPPVASEAAPTPAQPEPATATSVGLALVAIDEPAPADATSLAPLPASIDVGAGSAWDEQPMAPPVAAPGTWDEQPMASIALDPATATSIGLTLVAVEPPVEVAAAPAPDVEPPPAPVATATIDPATATSVGLTLVAVDPEPAALPGGVVTAAVPDDALDVEMDVPVEAAVDVEMDAAMEVDVGDADEVAAVPVADVDASGAPLASQWADAAERPIPRQETDTRNALGWIPPSREILVVPEEAGPAPEPVQAYAPAAAPKAAKPAAPWARFAPKTAPADPAPTPVPAPEAPVEPGVVHTLELASPLPDDDAGATLEMARPVTVDADPLPAAPGPVATLRIDPALLARTTDVDGDPALPTEPHARPFIADDVIADDLIAEDVLDTATLARPDLAGPGTDVDGEPALPTLQMASPPAGLMADDADVEPAVDGGAAEIGLEAVEAVELVDAVEAVEAIDDGAAAASTGAGEPWLMSEPGRLEHAALPAPVPAATRADPWVVPSTEVSPPEPAADVAPPPAVVAPTAMPEDEVAELAPWPGSPGATEGPPPMKLTPTMVMRMDPAEQRKLLALLLEKANVGPEILGTPGDPDKPSS